MASYALIKFKINKDFFDWEQAFYSSQPMARQAGIVELFHGRTALFLHRYRQKRLWISFLQRQEIRSLHPDIYLSPQK